MSTTSRSTPASTSAAARSVGVGADADRRADSQASLASLRGVRVLDLLLNVLDRDQAGEIAALIHDRQLLDPVAVQDRFGLLERRARRAR